jgi:4-amino-4-deoxy-L-arabinose transferase-like glycosyltransferase
MLEVKSTWLVALCSFMWLAATTGLYPLLLPDEGRYVGVAWEMLSSGDFAVPRLDGLPFFHKPPLFYWTTALSLDIFGVNPWAARLSSVLAATLMVALMFWFLKNFGNPRLAAMAAIILATQPFFYGGSHYANLDMTVAGIISATVIAGAVAVFRRERGQSYAVVLALTYILAGLGFMSKGLIGVVLPGGIIFFWLLARRRFDSMLTLLWLPGMALFLLVSLPWMLLMQYHYPNFFQYYIIYQHFERFLETGFNNPHPFWFYVPVLLALTLPWSAQLWRLARRSNWVNNEDASVDGLMLSWLLVVVIFFSVPTSKLVGYVLPALPPIAYFVAKAFTFCGRAPRQRGFLPSFSWSLLVSIALCLTAVAAMVLFPQPTSKGLAAQLRQQWRSPATIVMLHMYRYDLDFYLKTAHGTWVVSDWNDPRVKQTDNWRKELYDAGQFEPAAAARTLLLPQDFLDGLCASHDTDFWVIGDRNSPKKYGFLRDMQPAIREGKLQAWHVRAGQALSVCAETPRIGPE